MPSLNQDVRNCAWTIRVTKLTLFKMEHAMVELRILSRANEK